MTGGTVDVASSVASYVPRLALRNLAPGRALTHSVDRFPAAVLFVDVVGSSALTERLAVIGSQGIEQLAAHLNAYFGELIAAAARHGGEVYRFAGDAMLVVWPVLESGQTLAAASVLAAECGVDIQSHLHNYQLTDDIRLSVRVGIGAGDTAAVHVGGVAGKWEYVMVGAPFVDAGRALQEARPGQTIISPEVIAHAGSSVNTPVPTERVSSGAPEFDVQLARRYVLPLVLDRLDSGQTDWLAELRRVTAMFVQVHDFDVSAPDMEDRLQRLTSTAQRVLAAHGGTLCHMVMADKGLVLHCVFGLPAVAGDDDAERALRAAMTLMADLSTNRVASSIGIATGPAFCGPIGNALRREYNLLGSAINLAAGLAALGRGGVVCDEVTRIAARGRVAFEELPGAQLKGRPGTTPVYRPTRAVAPGEAPPGDSERAHGALVGRVLERTVLAQRLDRLVDGAHEGVLVVEADAGMGKSRLIADFVDQARLRQVNCLVGATDSIEQSTPFFAFRSVFRQLVNTLCGALAQADPLAALADVLVVDATGPRDREQVSLLLPLLGTVLQEPYPESELTRSMSNEARADYTRELLIRILHAAVRSDPLVVVIEDAHWLDSASWALARLASERVTSLLFVLATRPLGEEMPLEARQLLSGQATQRVVLAGLTAQETVELACQRLGVSTLPRSIEALIWDKAEGHPFYTEELASALRDTGVITVEDGHARLTQAATSLTTLAFPPTLQGAITARIDRLSPSQQLTLKVASVIGRQFTLDAICAGHPTSVATQVEADLDVLEQLELTHRTTLLDQRAYAFRHVLTQDVVYNLMLFAQRRRLHRAMAEWYEATYGGNVARFASVLAYHWTRALEDPTDAAAADKAKQYLEQAGEQARASDAQFEAIRLFEEALRIDTQAAAGGGRSPRPARRAMEVERRARWEQRVGESYFRVGNAPDAIRHLREAVSLLGMPLSPSRPGMALGLMRDAVEQLLHQLAPAAFMGRAAVTKRAAIIEAAQVYAGLSLYTFINMDELTSIAALLRGQNLAERAGPSAVWLRTSHQMAAFTGLLFGSPKLFEHYIRPAHEFAAAVSNPANEGELYFGRGLYMTTQTRWEDADASSGRALDLFTSVGDRRWAELSRYQLANIAHFQGELDHASTLSRETLAAAEARGDVQMQAWLLGQQAHILLLQGQPEAALALLADSDDRLATSFTRLADPAAEFWVKAARALALAHLDDRTAALEAGEAAAALIKPYLNFMYYSARGFGDLAEAAMHLWESTPADDNAFVRVRRLADISARAADQFASRSPLGRPQAFLWRGQHYRLAGKPARAKETLRKAVDAAVESHMPYEAALARDALGRASRNTSAAESEELLTQARDGFARMGAQHHLRQVERSLHAAPRSGGARPTP